jgi:single-strand DNA-binding protein
MPDLNKVFLMGRLTFDPELRRTPSGTAVTELRMATGRSWTGRDGERREETLFIDVTVWDRQAETCCQYLRKGSALHVEGYLRVDSWDDKTTGEKRSKIRVQAERVQFLDARRNDGAGGDAGATNDEELGGSMSTVREPASRRASSAGAGEMRGQSNGAGAGRAPFPPTANSRSRQQADPEERDEEDIPF